ncbi:tissue factor pathway inhibitor [Molossus molossus]|uniref:tissue factor pathway inhibitor n=1 Tax=Molossus molossus TaxID=27622 RepID=UPI0017469B31|nr:tissue factor pathway inhibitor [Molossus molossus]
MKKDQIFWASVCLLLGCASVPLRADPAEGEDDAEATVAEPVIPARTFCAYKADSGPCRAMLKRYYFNIQTQQCEEFVYGGCEGNENQFESLEECKKICTRDYSMTASKNEKPSFCFLEEDVGICRGYFTRYFYNSQSKQCETFVYGGCFGNLNNFESLGECKATCDQDACNLWQLKDDKTQLDPVHNDSLTPQPTKIIRSLSYHSPYWCLTPADRGLCKANESRFYYNSNVGKCLTFNYSGCGGNENNFVSKRACLRACQKAFIKRIPREKLIKTKRKKKYSVIVGYHDDRNSTTMF